MQGLRTQDLFTARVCAVLVNLNRTSQTDRTYTPADFQLIPPANGSRHNGPAAPPAKATNEWTEGDHLEILEALNKAFGGRDRRFGAKHG